MTEDLQKPPPRFQPGVCEVSDLASDALSRLGIDPQTLFNRHQSGDWGAIPEGEARGNDRLVEQGPQYHTIASRYVLDDDVEVLVVTGMSWSRTRLQLAHEYQTTEVSSAEGYAKWAQEYDQIKVYLVVILRSTYEAPTWSGKPGSLPKHDLLPLQGTSDIPAKICCKPICRRKQALLPTHIAEERDCLYQRMLYDLLRDRVLSSTREIASGR